MSLAFAIDALYDTGWHPTDPDGVRRHSDGRPFPSADAARRFFESRGLNLSVKHIQLFGCYRAEWADAAGRTVGAVVGMSEDEAAVFAMARVQKPAHIVEQAVTEQAVADA